MGTVGRKMLSIEISIKDLRERVDYNPETGAFTWKIDVAKNIKAGTEAGCIKVYRINKFGEKFKARAIRVLNKTMPASRVAWALHYGEWPTGRIWFKNDNALDCRIENLKMGNVLIAKIFPGTTPDDATYKAIYRERYIDLARDKRFKKKFGISLEEYNALSEKQDHKCAICKCAETATRGGKIKLLAVDHNHQTGEVRGLLCNDCNQGIGKLKDNVEVLQAAIDYLNRTSSYAKVPVLKLVKENTE